MDGDEQDRGTAAYKSPRHAQVWFLARSRRTWKKKYMELKVQQKRLLNRVRDVTKSREKWQGEARADSARVQELEAENAALKKELEVLKKRRRHRAG